MRKKDETSGAGIDNHSQRPATRHLHLNRWDGLALDVNDPERDNDSLRIGSVRTARQDRRHKG